MADHPMSAEEFLRQVGQIVKMPIDKPEAIVSALRDVRADFDAFAEWAGPYLDAGSWGGHSILDAIKQETITRDEEVKRLRALCARAAEKLDEYWDDGPAGQGWQSDVLTKLVSDLRGAAEGKEVTHG
jgi:hypothetical protein